METRFIKNVSRGSRFNQIYIPTNMEGLIEVGDEVEVRLIRKHAELFYSKGLKKLSHFKEKLIKDVFSFLKKIKNYSLIFAVGSFLTEKISYNDIDIVIITGKSNNNLDESLYNKLIEKFNLKFHVLVMDENKFSHLLKICPLTRAMFSRFICDKKIAVPDEKSIDKKHIKFLLMMPYDLLDIKLSSRAFFDSIRRLNTIERFLDNKNLNMISINEELKKLLTPRMYHTIKNNENIEENSIQILRKIIKSKLEIIEILIKNGKK